MLTMMTVYISTSHEILGMAKSNHANIGLLPRIKTSSCLYEIPVTDAPPRLAHPHLWKGNTAAINLLASSTFPLLVKSIVAIDWHLYMLPDSHWEQYEKAPHKFLVLFTMNCHDCPGIVQFNKPQYNDRLLSILVYIANQLLQSVVYILNVFSFNLTSTSQQTHSDIFEPLIYTTCLRMNLPLPTSKASSLGSIGFLKEDAHLCLRSPALARGRLSLPRPPKT